jgi:hypothetical protein
MNKAAELLKEAEKHCMKGLPWNGYRWKTAILMK